MSETTDVQADILASRTVAVVDDLHSIALDVEEGSGDLDDLADALDDARQEIEALDQPTRRAQH